MLASWGKVRLDVTSRKALAFRTDTTAGRPPQVPCWQGDHGIKARLGECLAFLRGYDWGEHKNTSHRRSAHTTYTTHITHANIEASIEKEGASGLYVHQRGTDSLIRPSLDFEAHTASASEPLNTQSRSDCQHHWQASRQIKWLLGDYATA